MQFINFGNGHSGSPNSISGVINNYATVTGTAGGATVTTALSVSVGDQVLLHQTQHATAAGTWELVKVLSTGSGSFTAKTNLVNSYTTGAQAVLIPQYIGGTISGAVTGTAWNGTVGGIVALLCNSSLTISGSVTAPAGFRGGTGTPINDRQAGHRGENEVSNPQDQNSNNNGRGGGAGNVDGSNRSGGGGAGYGAAGTIGTAGGTAAAGAAGAAGGLADMSIALLGAGGGSGGTDSNEQALTAGAGGGFVLIIAKNITITGTIPSTGGTPGASNQAGGSGGGAGGSILIKSQVATLGTSRVTAAGGTGGTGNHNGGAGGVGRIRLNYLKSYTGTTSPTLNAAVDASLKSSTTGLLIFV